MKTNLQKEKESQDIFQQVILGVAHELNNPNTFIRMNTINLKKMFALLRPCLDSYEKSNPETKYGPYTLNQLKTKISQHLDSTLDATVRLIAIAERLKECTSTALSSTSAVPMKEVIEEIIASHQFILTRNQQVTFVTDKKNTYIVSGYRLQLEQTLSSLIINACHAISERYKEETATKGLLKISLSKSEKKGTIVVTVEDNGTGMDKNTLEKAFTPYFTTKPHGMGDGLGLAICQSVLLRHGGSIAIETEYGQGTKIVVELPENN